MKEKKELIARYFVITNDESGELTEEVANHILKEVGYPRHRAWADSLDSRCDILLDDFLLSKKLFIASSRTDAHGVHHIVIQPKNDRYDGWMR